MSTSIRLQVLFASAAVTASGCVADSGALVPELPEWTVSSEPTVSIGAEGEDLNYLLPRIASVRLLEGGSVVVADGSSSTIRTYDSNGTFQLLVGAHGERPGEFQYISALTVFGPDTMAVYDSQHQRLTRFDTTGELLGTTEFTADDGRPELYLGRLANGEHVIAWIVTRASNESRIVPDLMRVGRFGVDGRLLGVLTTDFGMRRLRAPVPFSGYFVGAATGNVVYHTDGMRGEIARTTSTQDTLSPITLPTESWEPTDAWDVLRAETPIAAHALLSELRRTPGIDSIPHLSNLLLSSDGRLWAKQFDPATDSHFLRRPLTGGTWFVLSDQGDLVAKLSVPDGFRLTDVHGDQVVGVVRDELDVERVEVRTIARTRAVT